MELQLDYEPVQVRRVQKVHGSLSKNRRNCHQNMLDSYSDLDLLGHLKEMLTWPLLTPNHDLTSVGVLLGLLVANVGSGNQHITKLLAVHTPVLLPTPTVDLNVSLLAQAAGYLVLVFYTSDKKSTNG
jgi:hypothetical protein